ncbi:hypothetical protein RQP46_010532 [Phenoliferia psychrophenolica]
MGLFGGKKTKSREVLQEDSSSSPPPPLPGSSPPAPPAHSAHSLPALDFGATSPQPAFSQPTSPSSPNATAAVATPPPKKRFGFGRKPSLSRSVKASTTSNGHANGNGHGQGGEGYDQARAGWATAVAPPGLAPLPQQQPPVQVLVHDTRPPRVDNVVGVIGWSCANPTLDYPLILALCDHISLSSAAAQEAARALRKEIKYAVPDAQERAVRLLGIVMRNSDHRFKQQVANKKFIAALQELATSKKTEPRVVDMLLRVLSPLAYDYQRDADLSPITQLWNKLKPPDAPVNGAPLAVDDPLFTPTMDPRRGGNGSRNGSGGGGGGGRNRGRFPTQAEHLAELRKDAAAAKGNAAMLSEAVAFTPVEELAANPLVAEFYAKSFASQLALASNLDWLSVQAEQSRAALRKNSLPLPPVEPPTSPTSHLASNNPFAQQHQQQQQQPQVPNVEQQETDEERMLAVCLAANSDIIEALSQHDHRLNSHHQSQAEAAELLSVQERSLADTRFDRATAGVPDAYGNYLTPLPDPREGPSRSPSPSRSPAASPPPSPPQLPAEPRVNNNNSTNDKGKDPVKLERRISMNPYARYLPPASLGGYEVPDANGGERQQPVYHDEPQEEYLGALGSARPRRQGTADSTIETPSAPSAKALGKLRRVSMRTDSDPLEQQRLLEQKLREKYSRNYEDDVQRRSHELDRP